MVKRAAVVGHPITQSLSPELYLPWASTRGVDLAYERIDGQDAAHFADLISDLAQRPEWLGVNVTIPFKGEACRLATRRTPLAARLQAANLLLFRDGEIIADNTDVAGVIGSVEATGWQGDRGTARVLGAGGAAPAVIAALQALGFATIELTNRSPEKAERLAGLLAVQKVLPWAARDTNLGHVDLLINATSLGMKGQAPLELDLTALPQTSLVVDIVTTPIVTPLLAAAAARGNPNTGGIPMLVYQGVPAFEAWFGVAPPDPAETVRAITHMVEAPS